MPAPPGTPYTAGELKTIVDYLVEHRAYGQIKARKMWQDFAHTGLTNRTWQSLKETFLKRILPDLHNPYYKLTPEQKRSFKEGIYIPAKETKNKLELRSVDESSNTGDNQEQRARNQSGENDKPSKMDSCRKDSTDTVVLETCYETAEDIARDLESPRKDTSDIKSPSKSLRDLITYSEPLTPMAQEVIDDFATDEDEPKLQIVEDNDPVINGRDDASTSSKQSQASLKIRKSVRMLKTSEQNEDENKDRKSKSKSPDPNKIKLKLKRTRKGWENRSTEDEERNPTDVKKDQTKENIDESNKEHNAAKITKESGNKTTSKDKNVSDCNDVSADTQLPNNQEQLRKKSAVEMRVSNESEKEKPGNKTTSKDKKVSDCNDVSADTQLPNNQEQLRNKSAAERRVSNESEKEERPLRKRRLSSTDQKQQLKKKTQHKKLKVDDSKENDGQKSLISKENDGQKSPISKENDSQKSPIPKKIDGQKSLIPDIIVSNVEGTQTFDSHPNIMHNKTAQHVEDTYNSHENQVNQDSAKATAGSDIGTLSQSVSEASLELGPSAKKDVPSKAPTINPCLQSVSLYEEQFSTLHYSDSENEETSKGNTELPQKSKEPTKNDKVNVQDNATSPRVNPNNVQGSNKEIKDVHTGNKEQNEPQEVVDLKSHSESEERAKRRCISDSTADGLAKVFGFASASGAGNKRPGVMKRHRMRRTMSRNIIRISDDDSSYTSDSESEDLSRGQKQIPPQSYEILSHEGAEFVVYGKKLYPLMKKHKNKFHYVYGSETAQGDEEKQSESYWKKRFYEEQIRADELSRLLKRAEQLQAGPERSRSPILPTRSWQDKKNENDEVSIELNSDSSKTNEQEKPSKYSEQKKTSRSSEHENPKGQEKPVKIKFNVNNEIELECHPNHVPVFLEKMKALMNGNGTSKETPNIEEPPRTPTPEVRQKVAKKESEIFKEIAEKDKIDDTNVTKRKRGRPKKSIDSLGSSSAQKKRSEGDADVVASPQPGTSGISKSNSTTEETASEKIANQSDVSAEDKPVEVPSKRRPRIPKKFSVDPVSRSADTNEVTIPADDPNVRYKLPLRSHSETQMTRKTTRKYLEPRKPRILLSPETISRHSESSQGYQDSDCIPSPVKRKKKRSVSLQRYRKSSHPYQADVDSNDNTQYFGSKIESNKSYEPPSKTAKTNSTLNTSEYRSESFQNLMPKSKANSIQLEQVDENSNDVRSVATRYFSLSPILVKTNTEFETNNKIMERNSSITPFPSPEISLVENMSISKDIVSGAVDHPTLNEIQILESMDTSGKSTGNKYMISDVDVTAPLMGQDCEVHKASKTAMSVSGCPSSAASDTLLVNTDNLEEESSSDSLDARLRNLLLESAKKMSQQMQAASEKSSIEIDDILSTIKKVRSQRSSTSRKRLSRASTPLPPPVLDEHVESCSKGGRKSCPPVINVISCESPTTASLNINPVKTKRGRQKDVIKVKILKPKKKSLPQKTRMRRSSRLSVYTDSGMNDTERGSDDSDGLIHNHSETCLQGDSCVGESLELVDSPKTVVNISSDSELSQIGFGKISGAAKTSNDTLIAPKRSASHDSVSSELFCDNAQDATNLNHAPTAVQGSQRADSIPSIGSYNSLITEDLSDESPPPKPSDWYLLSEDETNNAEARSTCNHNVNSHGLQSNLIQLFSSCAVPDLSTISEGSREENSRRETFDSNSNTY